MSLSDRVAPDLSHRGLIVASASAYERRLWRQLCQTANPAWLHEIASVPDGIAALPGCGTATMIADWELLAQQDGALMDVVRARGAKAEAPLSLVVVMRDARESRVKAALAAGVEMLVAKPIVPKHLWRAIRRGLGFAPAAPHHDEAQSSILID